MKIAISDDGMVFHTMGFLVGNRLIDYPHVFRIGFFQYDLPI